MERNFKYTNIDLGILTVKIPIIEIGNKNSDKKLAITCCVHGNETSSLFIINEVLNIINENLLKGYIKVILISNPIANYFNKRCSPQDIQDMNRLAPGNNNGTVTERICRVVMNEIISCNYYIDIHEWSLPSLLQGIVLENSQNSTKEISEKMIDVFKPDILTVLDSKYIHSIYGFINEKRQIPGFTIELSSDTVNNKIEEERVVKSLVNLLIYLDIYDDTKYNYTMDNYLVIKEVHRYIAQKSGLFFPDKKVGDNTKKGDRIGYLLDLNLNDKIELYNVGDYTTVLELLPKKYVNAGDLIGIIGK